MTKRCFKCGLDLPLSEFYKHPMMADGLLGKCKGCAKSDVAKNYRDKIEDKRAYERKRFQSPERKEAAIEYQRRQRQRDPEKYRTRLKTARAIRSGKLVRMPCEVCGEAETEAHHKDYSDPMDIKWLCFRHHRKEHGQLDYETET